MSETPAPRLVYHPELTVERLEQAQTALIDWLTDRICKLIQEKEARTAANSSCSTQEL